MLSRLLLVCGFWHVLALFVPAADWPAFRGARGDGVSHEKDIAVTWGPDENIRWKVRLPGRGFSSPIVSSGRVFLTSDTNEGRDRTLFCFDRDDGRLLWSKSATYDKPEPVYQDNPFCTSTPVADGERVVVWHGSAGLFCYDFDGNELWSVDLGEFRHMWGYASSPILHRGRVVLNCGPGVRTFMTAIDLETGETVWKTDEPGGHDTRNPRPIGSWSTPVVANIGGSDQIVCSMPTRVVAYDPDSGEPVWWCGGLPSDRGDLVYTSPVLGEDAGIAMGGYNGPAIGFRLGGRGDMTESNLLWRNASGNPQRIGSGVLLDGHLYIANAGPSTAQCIEAATGRIVWEGRLPGANIWGSTVLADGRLYATNKRGVTHVFLPTPEKFELVANNDLGEPCNATPAISDGWIYLRTDETLYCIGED